MSDQDTSTQRDDEEVLCVVTEFGKVSVLALGENVIHGPGSRIKMTRAKFKQINGAGEYLRILGE
jgi:hypothetical protein